jgi:hypothetical protein
MLHCLRIGILIPRRHRCNRPASLWLQSGINIKIVSQRLGHAKVSTTLNTYAHVIPDTQDQVTAKLDAEFGSKGCKPAVEEKTAANAKSFCDK